MSCDKDALIYLADVRIDELEVENAKLHAELTDLRLGSCPSCGIKVENERLRELVRHLRECTRHNVCAACEYAEEACDFDYDMRKLGIEVDA